MGADYSHFTLENRRELFRLLSCGKKPKEIAPLIGVHLASVYRELERGKNPETGLYDPEYADKCYKDKLNEKGSDPLLFENRELANKISQLILEEELSPERIIEELKRLGYEDIPSKPTIYAAIEKGLIPGVYRETLFLRKTKVYSDGTIHLPLWLREELSINDGTVLSIDLEGDKIILSK